MGILVRLPPGRDLCGSNERFYNIYLILAVRLCHTRNNEDELPLLVSVVLEAYKKGRTDHRSQQGRERLSKLYADVFPIFFFM